MGLSLVAGVSFFRKQKYKDFLLPDVLVPLVLIFFVGLFYTSTVFVCTTPETYTTLNKQCHTNGITFDNLIPKIFAENIYRNQEKNLIGDWQGSDRPPLQSGATLLASPLTINNGYSNINYEILAVLSQCLWIPAVWLLGRKFKLNNLGLSVLLIFCIFSGFFFFNSVFTWPKLLAGSLVVFAISLVLFEKKSKATWLIAATALALGFLAHSSVIFTIIPLVVLLITPRFNPGWKNLALLGCMFFAICLPWLGYQKLYDPPGDRLLKWHIGGVEKPDNTKSFIEVTKDTYENTPPSQIFENKLSNFRTPFGEIPPDGSLYGNSLISKFRDAEFRYLIFGLGLLNIGWLYYLKKSIRKKEKTVNACIGLSLASILLWAFTLYGPDITVIHAGSYANVILLFASLTAVLVYAKQILMLKLLVTVQLVYFMIVWVYSVWNTGEIRLYMVLTSTISLFALLIILYKLQATKKELPKLS